MSEIIDIIRVKCPSCKKKTIADQMSCGCIFGHCEHCGTDFSLGKY